MNITTAIDRFTRQLAANGRSVYTQAAYRRDLEALARWVGLSASGGRNPDLRRITPDALARFLTSDAVLLTPQGDPRHGGQAPLSDVGQPHEVGTAVVLCL